MERVGVRRFRERLTHYLSRVRMGESFVITDREAPVALVTPAGSADATVLAAMVSDGLAEWHGGKPRGLPDPPTPRGGSIADIVLDARR